MTILITKLKKIEKTNVENDVAERVVKFFRYYNNILTKNETEKQFVCRLLAKAVRNTQLSLNPLFRKNDIQYSQNTEKCSHCSA